MGSGNNVKLTRWVAYQMMVSARNLLRYGRKNLFTSVAIETSSWCNRKCEYCPNKTNTREKKLLDMDVIRDIISQLEGIGFDGAVYFHLFNEPLLDKRLPEIVGFTRGKCPGAVLRLSTNGDFLSLRKARVLFDSGLDEMLVTQYDGRINANVSEVVESLDAAERKRVSVRIRDKFDNNRAGAVEAIKCDETLMTPCYRPERMLVINYLGKVVVCCNDYFGQETMGDAGRERLLDIWFGERLSRFRQDLKRGERATSRLCARCNEALPFAASLSDLSKSGTYAFLKKIGFID